MTNFWLKRQYAEVSTSPDGLAERGYVYAVAEFLTIASGATSRFGVTTNGVEVEFQYYDIGTDLHPVEAVLIENPESFTLGTGTITPRNLNRNYPDDATADAFPVAAVTGGVIISSEMVGASKGGGYVSQNKIFTLKQETTYVMTFTNTGPQSTRCHFNLGWAEADPQAKPLWTS